MAWAHVHTGGAPSVGPVASLSCTLASVTIGNLVVFAVTTLQNSTATPTVSISDTVNTYTQAIYTVFPYQNAAGWYVSIGIYYTVATTNASLTIAVTPSVSAYLSVAADEYSFTGGATISVDGTSHNQTVLGTTTTTPTSDNITLTGTDLVYGVMCPEGASGGTTAGTGYTLRTTQEHAGGGSGTSGIFPEDFINDASSPANTAYTILTTNYWEVAAAAFKATAAGGPTSQPASMLLGL
jgi:hypothetical protein